MVKTARVPQQFRGWKVFRDTSYDDCGENPPVWRSSSKDERTCTQRGYHVVENDRDESGALVDDLKCYQCGRGFSRLDRDYRVAKK